MCLNIKSNFIVIKTSIDGLQQAISLKDPQWRRLNSSYVESNLQSFLDSFLENI